MPALRTEDSVEPGHAHILLRLDPQPVPPGGQQACQWSLGPAGPHRHLQHGQHRPADSGRHPGLHPTQRHPGGAPAGADLSLAITDVRDDGDSHGHLQHHVTVEEESLGENLTDC